MSVHPVLTTLKSHHRLAGLDIHSLLCLKSRVDQFGAGDISTLYQLVDKAAAAGLSLIQFCPIHDTGLKIANPYMPVSAFSYNLVFADINDLSCQLEPFLQTHHNLVSATKATKGRYNYQAVYKLKLEALRYSFELNTEANASEIILFLDQINPHTLNYIKYKAIASKYGTNWTAWPDHLKNHAKITLQTFVDPDLKYEYHFQAYIQWILHRQWQKIIQYAQAKQVAFVTDKPIYSMPNSADVWANPSLYYLDSNGTPRYLSGCNNPGDPFGQQIWGHAVYRFQEKPEQITQLFLDNIQFLSQISPVIRLDNTLSLIWKYYLIEPETTAGYHEPAIKDKLFQPLLQKFPDLYFIAEDVGYLSVHDVELPLQKLNLPGLRCFQWYHPKYTDFSSYPALSVAITANHDTQSMAEWLQTATREDYQHLKSLNSSLPDHSKATPEILSQHIFNTNSQIAIITLRDLENDPRRYNLPGTNTSENWSLQMSNNIEDLDFTQIQQIISLSQRRYVTAVF